MTARMRVSPPAPDFSRENALIARGCRAVAGVDEAGRGPLAGPVVVAAVILDPNKIPQGLNDSKKLTAKKRDALYEQILTDAHCAIAVVSAAMIDQINIRAATLRGMRDAVLALAEQPDHVLIDGRDVPPDLPCAGQALIGGDGLSVSIAAASIVAKVTRDRLMEHASLAWPHYGFDQHKGYGTAAHLKAIADHGPCPLHRLSFAPLKA